MLYGKQTEVDQVKHMVSLDFYSNELHLLNPQNKISPEINSKQQHEFTFSKPWCFFRQLISMGTS